jgi:hypothetical protein
MTRVTEWVLGIVGGIAAFLGLFILLGPENEYLGLGGDNLTWRVGDIDAAWGYWLLIGGAVLLLATVALVMWDVRHPRAHGKVGEFAGLMWHTGIFVVVNAFLWIQDIAAGGGLEYAYWITIPWAFGVLIHAGAYLYATRRVEEPEVETAFEKKPSKELQHH